MQPPSDTHSNITPVQKFWQNCKNTVSSFFKKIKQFTSNTFYTNVPRYIEKTNNVFGEFLAKQYAYFNAIRSPSEPKPSEVNSEKPIVILVHGFGNRSGSLRFIKKHLQDKGIENIFRINLGFPSVRSITSYSEILHKKIKSIENSLQAQNKKMPTVNIVAHSMGGVVAETYRKNYKNSTKIDKIIAIGSPLTGIKTHKITHFLPAVRDMQKGSKLLTELKTNIDTERNLRNKLYLIGSKSDTLVPHTSVHNYSNKATKIIITKSLNHNQMLCSKHIAKKVHKILKSSPTV